jgi:uncharacterized membrane protein
MLDYLIIFILFSIIGWLYEWYIIGKQKYDGISEKLLGIKLPLLPIYGSIGIFLLYIHKTIENPVNRIWVSFVCISILECIFGLCSNKFYGYQTWSYNKKTIPLCKGYISIVTSFYWSILSGIFFMLLDYNYNYT